MHRASGLIWTYTLIVHKRKGEIVCLLYIKVKKIRQTKLLFILIIHLQLTHNLFHTREPVDSDELGQGAIFERKLFHELNN